MTLIARRSKEFAGTRFLKRGANDEVCVAIKPPKVGLGKGRVRQKLTRTPKVFVHLHDLLFSTLTIKKYDF